MNEDPVPAHAVLLGRPRAQARLALRPGPGPGRRSPQRQGPRLRLPVPSGRRRERGPEPAHGRPERGAPALDVHGLRLRAQVHPPGLARALGHLRARRTSTRRATTRWAWPSTPPTARLVLLVLLQALRLFGPGAGRGPGPVGRRGGRPRGGLVGGAPLPGGDDGLGLRKPLRPVRRPSPGGPGRVHAHVRRRPAPRRLAPRLRRPLRGVAPHLPARPRGARADGRDGLAAHGAATPRCRFAGSWPRRPSSSCRSPGSSR